MIPGTRRGTKMALYGCRRMGMRWLRPYRSGLFSWPYDTRGVRNGR
jgi:hypothetical protein